MVKRYVLDICNSWTCNATMNEEENGYYTSFDDYQSLEQQNKVYKDALEAIVKHQEIIGGSFSKYSSTHRIATEALK